MARGNGPIDRRPCINACALALALGLSMVGCQSSRDSGDPVFGRGVPGLEARLRGSGSSATGAVRVFDHRDGVVLQLSLLNVPTGTYRVALHEKGNCRSPNLFSAGQAWAPPDSGRTPDELLPQVTTDTAGDIPTYTAFIKGARAEGPQSLRGRTVVIHAGYKLSEAVPGQPNNRIACGVLDTIAPLF